MKLAAVLLSMADACLLAAVRDLRLDGVMVGGEDPDTLAGLAADEGLSLLAILGPAQQERAYRLGAWAALDLSDASLARVGSGPEVEDLLASARDPTAILWSDPRWRDPGSDQDPGLGDLAQGLFGAGFEGCLGFRSASAERLALQVAKVREALAEHASWWDGSEDGY